MSGPAPSLAPGGLEVIAHRGYSATHPENTLVSFEAAIAAGADALEMDVHMSADGVPVVIHDATLERTTSGRGRVRDLTAAELRGLDAGSWFSPEFAAEGVPSLEEVLGAARGRVSRVYVELKGWSADGDLRRIVALLRGLGWEERAVLISFDWDALDRFRAHTEVTRLGYLADSARRCLAATARAAAVAAAQVGCDYRLLLADLRLLDGIRRAGLDVAVFTVNSPGDACRLVELGVQRLTTDWPGEMRDWLSRC